MIVGIDHVQLAMPRGGERRARAFYAELLGMAEVPKPEPLAARGGVWFVSGRAHLHLGVEDDHHAARKAHPALLVEDLRAVVLRLREASASITEDDSLPSVRRAYVDDPFGNRIELIQAGDGFSER